MKSLDQLRRDAKSLRTAALAGGARALQRIKQHPPRTDGAGLKHADYLHIIAQEQNFASWPVLKTAAETIGLDRAGKLQMLKIALAHGQNPRVDQLLADTPDLAEGHFALHVALLDLSQVAAMLDADPGQATRLAGPRSPICHLAFSRRIHAQPDRADDMIEIAKLLVAHGASVNDGYRFSSESDHQLSALYGAIGHADNMILGRWLLEQGADPNDGESLYHATELGHHEGLRMLLEYGANPKGTNALLRAMDFHDHDAVQMLLAHGAEADEYDDRVVGGETPWVIPALHQAARRGSDAKMAKILLDAGADPARVFDGASAYGYARVFGNDAVAEAIAAQGDTLPLSPEETLLVQAAKSPPKKGVFVNSAKLPKAYQKIIANLITRPERLEHVRNLVALGVPYDQPDSEGLTPIQIAGWQGLPEAVAFLLTQRPDLEHVNGYGGTLLSTIIHGSENCPERASRDYIRCLEIVLTHGLALPRSIIAGAGDEEVSTYLADWAAAHPGQVVD